MTQSLLFRSQLILLVALALLLAACSGQRPYLETFDETGNWRVGDDLAASGQVADGVYRLTLNEYNDERWSTAGESFANGIFSVEATQTAGPVDAGYGMMFRVDDQSDAFYVFKISSDGFAWIGRCLAACAEETVLVDQWWFESSAIQQGLQVPNTLKVEANDGNMIFSINDLEIGRVTDQVLSEGDIGVVVQTIDRGNVTVEFDNFSVTPLE